VGAHVRQERCRLNLHDLTWRSATQPTGESVLTNRTPRNSSTISDALSVDTGKVGSEAEAKLRSIVCDIQRCATTGNPQHLYYAQQRIVCVVEMLSGNWDVETE